MLSKLDRHVACIDFLGCYSQKISRTNFVLSFSPPVQTAVGLPVPTAGGTRTHDFRLMRRVAYHCASAACMTCTAEVDELWHHNNQHNDNQHHDTHNNDNHHNDTQHNYSKYNDTKHNDTKHNDTKHNDTKHNDTKHNDTKHNDTQHNDT